MSDTPSQPRPAEDGTKRTVRRVHALFLPILIFVYVAWGFLATAWAQALMVFYVGIPLYVIVLVIASVRAKRDTP